MVKVWYSLKDQPTPSKVEVDEGADIDDLKKAIKTERTNDLSSVDAARLSVFAAGADTESDVPLDPWERIPTGTSGKKALIVVVRTRSGRSTSSVETIPEHMVPVLLTLAVSTMKSGWEKTSSERTKSESSTARNNSVSYYGLQSRKTCQILGPNTAHVKNAHIWPHNNSQWLVLVDLQPSDIDDPRNVLRLHEDIEYYLDRFRLTFVLSGSDFILTVLDPTIRSLPLKDRSETFQDLDGRKLQCPSGSLPWRCLLSTHSILSHREARDLGWLPEDQFTEAETNANELMEFSFDDEVREMMRRFLNDRNAEVDGTHDDRPRDYFSPLLL